MQNTLLFMRVYESVFAHFEREYEKPVFWKNGKLY